MSSEKEIEIFDTGVKLLNETLTNISEFDKASLLYEMAARNIEKCLDIKKEETADYCNYLFQVDGMSHKTDGPAYFTKHVGFLNLEEYCIFGRFHRRDGPAIINGARKEYYQMGFRHRMNGPAYINQKVEQFWVFGKQLSYEAYLAAGGTIENKNVKPS